MWKEGSNRFQGRRNFDRSRSNLNKRRPEGFDQPPARGPAQKSNEPRGPKPRESELNQDSVITDCQNLLKACEAHELVKVYSAQVGFNRNLMLKDISIKVKGPQEDMIYAAKRGIYVNVRRGNTLLVMREEKSAIVCRKGLKKFYDLYPEYLDFNLGQITSLEGKIGIKEANENKSIHKKIFGELKSVYDSSAGGVVVFEANKANGENCQISWVPQAGAWVVSSKNVAMLLRTLEDTQYYIGDRYHFAEIIAREWFATLKKLSAPQIEAIKECLGEYTIVGEYVGNQTYQHLVKYERQGFLFYALVNKTTSEEALNPRDAFAKIKALGLQTVLYKEHPVCNTWIDLNNKLKELYREVKESSIETREEGVVLYLVKRYNNSKEELVSLCKLKTLEYQIYRKLREKLRGMGDKKHTRSEIETKFQEEVKTLVGDSKLPQEHSFYFEVAKRAFDFAEKGEEVMHLIFGQYVSFLSIMVYCTVNSVPFSLGFFDKPVISDLYSTPWSKYTELKKKLKINESFALKTPRTIIFVPLTIPGMGKSYLFREVIRPYCEDNGLIVRYVSSDAIRKSEMDALRTKEPNASENVLFSRTRESADEAFNKMLIHHLKEKALEDKVIYIDKNHPPNAIKKTVELIHAHKPRHSDVRLLAVIPKTKNGLTLKIGEKEVVYPLSPEICLSCLVTVQTRKDHETLNGNGIDSAGVLLMFFNMFRDFKFDGPVLKEYGFNGGVSVDFYGENFNFGKDALDKLSEILEGLKNPGDKPRDIQKLDQLLGLMQDNLFNPTINRPTKESQIKYISTVLKNLPLEKPPQAPSLLSKIQPVQKGGQSTIVAQQKLPTHPVNQFWAESIKNNEVFTKMVEESSNVVAISKKEFKPKKVPLYLGIFLKNDEKSRIQNILRYSLAKVQVQNPDSSVTEDLNEFLSDSLTSWKWPEDNFHITTCYLGKDKPNTNTEFYKSFEEGVKFPFKFRHIVYVPGKIIFSIVYLDRERIKVENKFPHVTLATKSLPAQDSNKVMETMFGGVFYSKYAAGLKFGADKISTLTIPINNETCTVFLLELPVDIAFEAETKTIQA